MSNWVTAVAVNSLCVGFLAYPAFYHQSLTTQKLAGQYSTHYAINQQPVIVAREVCSAAQEEQQPTNSSPERGTGRRS